MSLRPSARRRSPSSPTRPTRPSRGRSRRRTSSTPWSAGATTSACYGIGEVCAQSGSRDAVNNNGAGPLGTHAGVFYRNSATSIAVDHRTAPATRSPWGSGATTSATSPGPSGPLDRRLAGDHVADRGGDRPVSTPTPEECLDPMILGPAGLEDGNEDAQQPRGPRRGLLEPAPWRGRISCSPTARSGSSSRLDQSRPCIGRASRWPPGNF